LLKRDLGDLWRKHVWCVDSQGDLQDDATYFWYSWYTHLRKPRPVVFHKTPHNREARIETPVILPVDRKDDLVTGIAEVLDSLNIETSTQAIDGAVLKADPTLGSKGVPQPNFMGWWDLPERVKKLSEEFGYTEENSRAGRMSMRKDGKD